MKKIYALVIALIILTGSAFSVIGYSVNRERDRVKITENILYGNKEEASGLKIVNRNHLNFRLFWETEYKIGKENSYKTNFNYTPKQIVLSGGAEREGVTCYNNIDSGFYHDTPIEKQTGIGKAFKELYDSVGPDETKYKTVYLSDYYDYYPIGVSFDLPHAYWEEPYFTTKDSPNSTKYVAKKFAEFFKIPVKEDDKVTIDISKDSDGESFSRGIDFTQSFDFYTTSAVAEKRNRCFFSICNFRNVGGSSEKDYIDTSLIPGGYGIYAFYYTGGDSGERTGIMADTLQTVYKLDKETSVFDLGISYDKTKLLMYTHEEDVSYLSVIDVDTMKLLQKIKIGDSSVHSIHEYDDFIVAESEFEITVISSENQKYKTEYTVAKAYVTNDKFQDLWFTDCMDYKNGKLVAVGNYVNEDDGFGYEKCGFFVSVYNENGLSYYAEYENSLDTNIKGDYDKQCRPAFNKPNTVEWE